MAKASVSKSPITVRPRSDAQTQIYEAMLLLDGPMYSKTVMGLACGSYVTVGRYSTAHNARRAAERALRNTGNAAGYAIAKRVVHVQP